MQHRSRNIQKDKSKAGRKYSSIKKVNKRMSNRKERHHLKEDLKRNLVIE